MRQHARMLLLLPGGTSGGALPKLAFLPDSDNRSVSVTKSISVQLWPFEDRRVGGRQGQYHGDGRTRTGDVAAEHYYRQI